MVHLARCPPPFLPTAWALQAETNPPPTPIPQAGWARLPLPSHAIYSLRGKQMRLFIHCPCRLLPLSHPTFSVTRTRNWSSPMRFLSLHPAGTASLLGRMLRLLRTPVKSPFRHSSLISDPLPASTLAFTSSPIPRASSRGVQHCPRLACVTCVGTHSPSCCWGERLSSLGDCARGRRCGSPSNPHVSLGEAQGMLMERRWQAVGTGVWPADPVAAPFLGGHGKFRNPPALWTARIYSLLRTCSHINSVT